MMWRHRQNFNVYEQVIWSGVRLLVLSYFANKDTTFTYNIGKQS